MSSIKDIKRRIKSVNNTKKVTRAMEMVAAAKMRRAVEAVLKTRTYANLSWGTVLNLSKSMDSNGRSHPLMLPRKNIKNIAIILMTSNRGLCGGYNSNIINKAHKSVLKYHQQKHNEEATTNFIIVGKKGAAVRKYFGYDIYADFPKTDLINEVREVIPIAKLILDDFLAGKFDKVMVAYTDYINAVKQEPRVKQLLPIDVNAQDEYLGIVGQDTRLATEKEFIIEKQDKYLSDKDYAYEYLFEPSPEAVLDEMIPRLVEIQLYQALLESNASEHSARMAAMHQATDAADDLTDELTLYYNKTRQANITREITEISAGANALA
jgi:F-type H+-transporting ATPase subunit gamma